jgi:beta-lactamase class C
MNPRRLGAAALLLSLIADPTGASSAMASSVMSDGEVREVVTREIRALVPANGAGGAAVAVRIEGRTLFFNYGYADLLDKRPVTSDSLFNLASIRKAFEATLLAQAVTRGEVRLDDPVAKYVVELQRGGYIRHVTLGQLAGHTSGLLLPSDYPPGPDHPYALPDFIRILNDWTSDRGQEPGRQHTYTHAGYVLLQLALERRFGTPIADLIDRRLLKPLGLRSTAVPERAAHGRAELAPALMRRAVQGYAENGDPIGEPGDQQSHFDFPGTGQMFSSARDLAVFMAAQLGELPLDPSLRSAVALAQRGVFRVNEHITQALAWEINDFGGPVIVDKPGGLNNSSTYIGLVPSKKLGVVILVNRGDQLPFDIARRALLPALTR